jgi:hypothetical protein
VRATACTILCATLVACPKNPPPKPDAAVAVSTLGGASCTLDKNDVECGAFERAEDAFEVVLKEDPVVLGVGEAHAQRGATVSSSTKRFTDMLLPLLAGRTSDLLVELMMPPKGCVKQAETMRSVQKPVVTQQAETNQNEYVAMGEAARKLGIVPDLLRPSCDDLASISDAGDDALDRSLETIARLTTTQAAMMLEHRGAKMVVTYGGALHNDATPPPERAAWAYGPALSHAVSGRYVQLDVYVPDFITAEESWRKQPWYGAWEKNKGTRKPLLFRVAPKSYVLVFGP